MIQTAAAGVIRAVATQVAAIRAVVIPVEGIQAEDIREAAIRVDIPEAILRIIPPEAIPAADSAGRSRA
jgi:hypothetical protein